MNSAATNGSGRPTAGDRLRQVTVTLAAGCCLAGVLVGVGFPGRGAPNPTSDALAADAPLLAPAEQAFAIWTPICLGLVAYTVWQWLPTQTRAARQRRIGWLAAASMLLDASWLLVVRSGQLWAGVLVAVPLLAVLAAVLIALHTTPPTRAESWAEPVLTDGTFGACLGWVAVATCANLTAALTAPGGRTDLSAAGAVGGAVGGGDVTTAVAVLAAMAAAGVALARRLGGRLAVADAMIWGLAWIAVGRTTSEPRSLTTAVAAVAAAVIIAATTASARRTRLRPVPAPGSAARSVPAR
jgi:hypothetical protein